MQRCICCQREGKVVARLVRKLRFQGTLPQGAASGKVGKTCRLNLLHGCWRPRGLAWADRRTTLVYIRSS
jgi:hypothetical protein